MKKLLFLTFALFFCLAHGTITLISWFIYRSYSSNPGPPGFSRGRPPPEGGRPRAAMEGGRGLRLWRLLRPRGLVRAEGGGGEQVGGIGGNWLIWICFHVQERIIEGVFGKSFLKFPRLNRDKFNLKLPFLIGGKMNRKPFPWYFFSSKSGTQLI